MTYEGTVKNGRIELPEGVCLPDGTIVRVESLTAAQDPAYDLAAEAVSTGLPDLAAQHDHYVYGVAKRAK